MAYHSQHEWYGRKSAPSHLSQQSTFIANNPHITSALGDKLSQNSLSSDCSDAFFAQRLEKHALIFTSSNCGDYNTVCSLLDYQIPMSIPDNSAPGPDGIYYELLKHLSSQSLQLLLDISNYIWKSGLQPSSWTEASYSHP